MKQAFNIKLGAIVLTALCMLPGKPLWAETPYTVNARVDWLLQTFHVEIKLDLKTAGLRLPSGRSEGERMIERDFPTLVHDAVFSVLVDSYRTISDTVGDGTLDIGKLTELFETKQRIESKMTKDLTTLVVSYSFPITALSMIYVKHTVPYELPPALRYIPTRPYSGIVIYAKGILPVRGEYANDKLKPCIFPRIYDESMRTILDRNLADPRSVGTWGIVAYADSLSMTILESRIGDDPLRIMAYQIFGTNRTDIVISTEDALRILGLPENRKLIQEGRVVIVFDLSEDD
jgi:hypothetical protein